MRFQPQFFSSLQRLILIRKASYEKRRRKRIHLPTPWATQFALQNLSLHWLLISTALYTVSSCLSIQWLERTAARHVSLLGATLIMDLSLFCWIYCKWHFASLIRGSADLQPDLQLNTGLEKAVHFVPIALTRNRPVLPSSFGVQAQRTYL